jgi:hypothetical protein
MPLLCLRVDQSMWAAWSCCTVQQGQHKASTSYLCCQRLCLQHCGIVASGCGSATLCVQTVMARLHAAIGAGSMLQHAVWHAVLCLVQPVPLDLLTSSCPLQAAASVGDTAPPSEDEEVDLHFIDFVCKEGGCRQQVLAAAAMVPPGGTDALLLAALVAATGLLLLLLLLLHSWHTRLLPWPGASCCQLLSSTCSCVALFSCTAPRCTAPRCHWL